MNECIGVTTGAPRFSAHFGNGGAGAIHVASGSTLTLTDALYASTVQVDPGGTIAAQGYPIFAMISFTNYGTVHSNGAAASGASGGAAVDIDGFGWSAGGVGGTGTGGDAPGFTLGTPTTFGNGTGGAGGAGTAGGGGQSASPTVLGAPRDVTQAVCAGSPVGTAALPFGVGGGGGGGDGTNSGGGGGGGAGNVLIASPTIVNAGTLSAQGGAGAAATAGNAGGGGGGGGGVVYVLGRSFTHTGTVVTSGGAGGAGHGSGSAGSSGAGGPPKPVVIQVRG